MTQDLNTTVSTMDSVFSRQDSPAGWLWHPLLRLLARGEPVTIAELAAATGRPGEEVAHAVSRLRDTEYDGAGRIVGYGITLRPTPHRFTVDGHPLYTWCAQDTLLFPAILGRPAQVESPCPTTGHPIRLTVEPDRITGVEPETAVVSIVTPDDLASVRASFCNHVHFFTDTDAAQPWLAEHPDGSVLPVAEAYQLGRRLRHRRARRVLLTPLPASTRQSRPRRDKHSEHGLRCDRDRRRTGRRDRHLSPASRRATGRPDRAGTDRRGMRLLGVYPVQDTAAPARRPRRARGRTVRPGAGLAGRRKVAKEKAHGLGGLLEWARGQAIKHGFAGVVAGCEPTGHRWRSVMQLADEAGVGFVCVQSLKVHLAREADDYTRDKTDHKDAVLIGKLISRLDCYLPERAEEDWARLRHLGQRRFRLVGEVVACRNQISDLLSCCWPAALECAIKPLESTTWLACLAVTVDRCNGNPAKLRKLGRDRFFAVVRRELPRFGAQRVCHRVAGQFFAALTDGRGVATQRRGALERVGLLMDDWRSTLARLAEVEARMVAVLNGLGLTAVVTSIPGLSAVGAAVILAETGDLNRFASARSVVKHARG